MLYSLSHINQNSPYRVLEYEADTACFITDSGVVYMVGFVEENNMGIPKAYQFFVTPRGRLKNVGIDQKIGQTIAEIIKSFFKNNENVLVYVCDTSDRMQAARNRKFKMWLHQYAGSDTFDLTTEEITIGEDKYFAAMITAKSYDVSSAVKQMFHGYFRDLKDKLE